MTSPQLHRTYIPRPTYELAKREAEARGIYFSLFLDETIRLGIKVIEKRETAIAAAESEALEAIA